jgi:hypothetical protein
MVVLIVDWQLLLCVMQEFPYVADTELDTPSSDSLSS